MNKTCHEQLEQDATTEPAQHNYGVPARFCSDFAQRALGLFEQQKLYAAVMEAFRDGSIPPSQDQISAFSHIGDPHDTSSNQSPIQRFVESRIAWETARRKNRESVRLWFGQMLARSHRKDGAISTEKFRHRLPFIEELPIIHCEPASSLHTDTRMRSEIVDLIAHNFPDGDDAEFIERFLADPTASLHCSYGDEEKQNMIGCIGAEKLGEDLPAYIDWLCAGKAGRVRGLSPLVLRAIEDIFFGECGSIFAVKPYVSLDLLLGLGAVCDGVALPGEYKHRGYVTMHAHAKEMGAYPIKAAGSKVVFEALKHDQLLLLSENQVIDWHYKGDPARLCKKSWIRMNSDAEPGPRDEWFYDTIRNECQGNQHVLSTSIYDEASSSALRQTHFMIFEPSKISGDVYLKMQYARQVRREKHAQWSGSHA